MSSPRNRQQKLYANRIKPIRKNGHLLLVTLLLANMIVNETLPIISDPVLGGGVQSVVVSTVLIVMYVFVLVASYLQCAFEWVSSMSRYTLRLRGACLRCFTAPCFHRSTFVIAAVFCPPAFPGFAPGDVPHDATLTRPTRFM